MGEGSSCKVIEGECIKRGVKRVICLLVQVVSTGIPMVDLNKPCDDPHELVMIAMDWSNFKLCHARKK